ncbi:glutamate receptor 3.2-like isoform X2 [Mercurialis annua]|uniref:glutamate receptor 3.2-like isoform X2 n=1 Tax=Mercurialis annua TaxID=3986 RepID=UPI00215E5C18|nr:glutamate receptor 3.2-like isoform X2 [Mercurialis annua]
MEELKKKKKASLEENVIHCIFVSFFVILLLQLLLNGVIHRSITTGRAFRKSDIELTQCFVAFDYYSSSVLSLQDSSDYSFSAVNYSAGSRRRRQLRRRREYEISSRKYENDGSLHVKRSDFTDGPPSRNVIIANRPSIGIMAIRSSQSMRLEQKRINEFAIRVFEAALKLLPYKLISYEKVPFYGSHHDLLNEVALKTIDAGVGDIIISAEGFEIVEFSQPYAEAKLVMLVHTETSKSQTWLFLSLFTPWMWFLLAATSFFTGLVIWLVEHMNHNNGGGSLAGNVASDSPGRGGVAVAFSFAFATLYFGQRERPNSILSHFVLAPWLILMLVVSATFTSSFTSKMANSQIEASKIDIDMLKRANAVVGYDGSSFSFEYLVEVLGFKAKNIASVASVDDYALLLSSGEIAVAFILMPYAKLFLAKYCTGFAIAGSTYELGGFGFAFPKGSTLASDMSKAIVRLRARGNLRLIEEEILSSMNCSASPSGSNARQSLGPEAFLGFFIISGCTSAIALLITLFRLLRQQWQRKINIQAELMGRGLWLWLATLFTQN